MVRGLGVVGDQQQLQPVVEPVLVDPFDRTDGGQALRQALGEDGKCGLEGQQADEERADEGEHEGG